MSKSTSEQSTEPGRVVILGAAGFVGSHVSKLFTDKQVNVVPLARDSIDLLASNAEHALAECLRDDDVLVMSAAIAPCKNYAQLIDNIKMAETVCNVVKNQRLRQVIYLSSDAIYADHEALVDEFSPAAPTSFHGAMHLARELMFKSVVGDAALCILRPSLLYGVDDTHNGYGPNRFFRLAQANKTISLFGGGEEKRDHVYIDDVAEVIYMAYSKQLSGVYNIATGQSLSFKDVAATVVQVTGSAPNLVVETERQNPITHRHFNISKLNKVFSDITFTSLAAGLALMHKQSDVK